MDGALIISYEKCIQHFLYVLQQMLEYYLAEHGNLHSKQ